MNHAVSTAEMISNAEREPMMDAQLEQHVENFTSELARGLARVLIHGSRLMLEKLKTLKNQYDLGEIGIYDPRDLAYLHDAEKSQAEALVPGRCEAIDIINAIMEESCGESLAAIYEIDEQYDLREIMDELAKCMGSDAK
jgi:hypothetical protein